ncbi:hypothetical protein D3C73_1447110 [compost metagenome]
MGILHGTQAMPGAEQLNDLWCDVLGRPYGLGDGQFASHGFSLEYLATATTIGM